MFRLIKFMIPLGLGIVMGWKMHNTSVRAKCEAVDGTWQNGTCLNSEVTQ